ncbi:MAG: ATP-dependent helicase, partial [Candidatus Saccharimonadales bacterium]
MYDELFAGLNPEQRRAVETTDGPLLIQAGAGSGKTKTLTHRIAYLIATRRATPFNILAVTFTNKAAKEMRQRVAVLLGENPDSRSFMPFMGTFHGICVRILRQDGEYVGVPRSFVIFDESDRLSAIKQASKQLMIDEKAFPPRVISSLISSAKNEMVGPAEYVVTADGPAQKAAAKVFPAYERILKEASGLDFDDLINRTVAMLALQAEIRKKWQVQFAYIMVDEYQDTNAAQYKLIKLLTNKNKNIAVVGDDWQSIYSWRGTDFRNILKFEKDYPSCCIIKLEQNYRSTKNILDAAHAIITKNMQRSDKQLWTEAGDGLPVQMVQVH